MALLIGLLACLVAAIVFGAFSLFFAPASNPEVVRDRMDAVRKAEQRGGDVSMDLQLVRDEMLSSVPLLNRLMLRLSWSKRLQDLTTQAGMATKPGQAAPDQRGDWTVRVCDRGIFLQAISWWDCRRRSPAAVPIIVVAFLRNRRLNQFEQRFPEALDLLGRAVRAGHAFTAGLEMVSKEAPEPTSGEFRTTFEEQNFGLPLRDALSNLAERVPLVDVRFFITALLIQKDTGGNLAELLDELSRLIRERFRIYREVQIKTAQGRLTAIILIALPVGMLLMMRITNPSYVNVLFEDPIGVKLLAGAAVLQVIGAAILWKIVQIEV